MITVQLQGIRSTEAFRSRLPVRSRVESMHSSRLKKTLQYMNKEECLPLLAKQTWSVSTDYTLFRDFIERSRCFPRENGQGPLDTRKQICEQLIFTHDGGYMVLSQLKRVARATYLCSTIRNNNSTLCARDPLKTPPHQT